MKVKLTEGQLRNMIAESIIKHLNEELMKVPSDSDWFYQQDRQKMKDREAMKKASYMLVNPFSKKKEKLNDYQVSRIIDNCFKSPKFRKKWGIPYDSGGQYSCIGLEDASPSRIFLPHGDYLLNDDDFSKIYENQEVFKPWTESDCYSNLNLFFIALANCIDYTKYERERRENEEYEEYEPKPDYDDDGYSYYY